MVKVVVNNGQYKITIPKDLAESKGWKKGTRLHFIQDTQGRIIIEQFKKR